VDDGRLRGTDLDTQSPIRGKAGEVRETTPDAVHASWIATLAGSRHARGLLIAAVAGVFLAVVGAFGSGEAPFWPRLAFWVIALMTGGLGGVAVSALVDHGGWFDDRPVLQGSVIAVALTIPLTLAIWLLSSAFFHGVPHLAHLQYYVGPVFVVTCVMTALNYFTQRAPAETHAAPAGAAPPRFLERLPAKLRGAEIHAVEAQDHYLRLHTSKGQDLILMRLSDAVAELEGVEGAQVHRSWWVARDAVADARRGDGKATLTLAGGVQVPVSRAYARALREAGWF
jgi:DNA-binding LytR/AlgR family response regulator